MVAADQISVEQRNQTLRSPVRRLPPLNLDRAQLIANCRAVSSLKESGGWETVRIRTLDRRCEGVEDVKGVELLGHREQVILWAGAGGGSLPRHLCGCPPDPARGRRIAHSRCSMHGRESTRGIGPPEHALVQRARARRWVRRDVRKARVAAPRPDARKERRQRVRRESQRPRRQGAPGSGRASSPGVCRVFSRPDRGH